MSTRPERAPRTPRPRARCLVALASALLAGGAGAEGLPLPPELAPPFPEPAAQPRRLRTAAEIGAIVGAGGVYYAVHPAPTEAPGSKGDGVRFDHNPFRTNFVGHPIAGAFYYQLARSNGLSALESSLWSLGGSTAWELVEYREPSSLNDLVVTPVGGVALGAPLFELAAHLDRGPRSTRGRILAWLVALPKEAHEAIDGTRPARGDTGDAFEASSGAAAGAARAGGDWRPEVRAWTGFRLVRDPRWGAPGVGTRALRDAAVSWLGLEVAVSPGGLADLSLDSGVLLAAVHRRDLAEDGAGVRGGEGLAGAGAGFLFRTHDWGPGTALDRLSVVELPALVAEGRRHAGPLRLAARISAGLTFGGVTSLALAADPSAVPPEDVPTVQSENGYHFALGVELAPAVEARYGRFALEAAGRGDWLRGLTQPDTEIERSPSGDFLDRWVGGRIAARATLAPGLELSAWVARQRRRSTANAASVEASETSLAAGLAWRP